MKGFIGGFPVALLAVAAQAMVVEQAGNGIRSHPVATVMGGPSGNDGDGGFVSPPMTNIKTNDQVNEWNKDDHFVHQKHTKVDPRLVMVPVAFGSPGPDGPRGSGLGRVEKRGVPGVTVMGGPSGDDGGESFNASSNVHTATGVFEHNEDDHSIGLNHENVYHPPPYRASALGTRSEGVRGPSLAGPPGKHFVPHPDNHIAPHHEPHLEPHFGNHFEPHPEPHFVNHPESHYDSHYSPSYEPHYEPHSELENDLTTIKDVNNAPAAGSISFGRRPTK